MLALLQAEFYRRGWPERFAKFNEADHPRDDDGKFGEAGFGDWRSIKRQEPSAAGQKDLFGGGTATATAEKPKAKAGGKKDTQQMLFHGLNDLPGQRDLFDLDYKGDDPKSAGKDIQAAAGLIRSAGKKLPSRADMEAILGPAISQSEAEAVLTAAGVDDITAADTAYDLAHKAQDGQVKTASIVVTARSLLTAADREGRLSQAVAEAGDATTLAFGKEGSPVTFMVHRATQKGAEGKWQTTRMDDKGASGHQHHDTREQAIGAVIGAHPDGSYWDEGDAEYRITKRLGGAKPAPEKPKGQQQLFHRSGLVEQFALAFAARGWPEKYREAAPKKKGEWVRLGGGGPAYVGAGGKITKACPGLKGQTVASITSESDQSRGERKARQDVADRHGVRGDEVTAEQARGLTRKPKDEGPEPWDEGGSPVPKPTSPQDQPGGARAEPKRGSINPKTRFGQAVLETAKEWKLPPDDLADACAFIFEEKSRQAREREAAKVHARRLTGLTRRDLSRLSNAGFDYSSARNIGGATRAKLERFDVWSQEVARQHPGLLGNPDDFSADLASGLWDLIAEGKQPEPRIHDRDIMRESAELVLASRGETKAVPEFEEAAAVAFVRRGMVQRYRRWMFRRENGYRRAIERYFRNTRGSS